MAPSTIELAATILFAVAVLHTFCVGAFRRAGSRFPEGTIAHDLLHLLAEVEAVFLLWAAVFMAFFAVSSGHEPAIDYLDHCSFKEPVFVFVVMVIASTRPILEVAEALVNALARLLPLPGEIGFAVAALSVGPLLGSLITEPAAITTIAHLLRRRLLGGAPPRAMLYALTGTLFVNVSIGGTLTNFAAPPVLMVARDFAWSSADLFRLLGWKAVVAVTINAALFAVVFRRQLAAISPAHQRTPTRRVPLWVAGAHIGFLALAVMTADRTNACVGSFLLFLGFANVTREYQSLLPLRSSLLVAGFLAGLVTLGEMQAWWVKPALAGLEPLALYAGASALTAITDNAALTFLCRKAAITPELRYALVAGAVTGGGLTIIANAPNPAGYAVLSPAFGEKGLSPLGLFLGAIFPTLVVICCFWFLP